jgi:hypothetical protein
MVNSFSRAMKENTRKETKTGNRKNFLFPEK